MATRPVAIVTGGGSGIGEAVATRLAADGMSVVVADISLAAAEEVAERLSRDGVATAVQCDVSVPADAERATAAAHETYGAIDVLVNNAGIVRDAQLLKMDAAAWDAVLAVNLTGVHLMCQASAPMMARDGGGRIVNIASRSLLGNFGQTNYSASKAGVVGLTKTLALELGPVNIGVNAIAPGYIETPIMRNVPEEVRERAIAAAPLRRVGTPEDVASAVSFLASRESSYITGQCLFVCGGRSLNAALEMWI